MAEIIVYKGIQFEISDYFKDLPTTMSCIYIDIALDNFDNIIEFAAIYMNNGLIQRGLHYFGEQAIVDKHSYKLEAHKWHCIPPFVVEEAGRTHDDMTISFKSFLYFICTPYVIIKSDFTKERLQCLFPFLTEFDIDYVEINLPPWEERRYKDYHISTQYLKRFTKILPCNSMNHSMAYLPADGTTFSTSHSELCKVFHGFNCTLFNVFEYAFYDKVIPLYCCDFHFQFVLCVDAF